MVASKSSHNHFVSAKCYTVQPFKLSFLQNSLLVQIHTYAGDCKDIGNIPGSHFVEAFSDFP